MCRLTRKIIGMPDLNLRGPPAARVRPSLELLECPATAPSFANQILDVSPPFVDAASHHSPLRVLGLAPGRLDRLLHNRVEYEVLYRDLNSEDAPGHCGQAKGRKAGLHRPGDLDSRRGPGRPRSTSCGLDSGSGLARSGRVGYEISTKASSG